MPPTSQYEIPAELAEKLEKMATGQGKTAEMLLIEIVTEYIDMTDAILRKAEEKSRKRKK
jgi:predicted DNA-binding protein